MGRRGRAGQGRAGPGRRRDDGMGGDGRGEGRRGRGRGKGREIGGGEVGEEGREDCRFDWAGKSRNGEGEAPRRPRRDPKNAQRGAGRTRKEKWESRKEVLGEEGGKRGVKR